MTDDIFSGGKPVEPQTPDVTALDTMLDAIRNEQGQRKYQSVEVALKALKDSQEYIPTLKAQLEDEQRARQELEEKMNEVKQLEDLVAQLTAQQQQKPPVQETPEGKGLDEQAVVGLVTKVLQQSQQQSVGDSNERSVTSSLVAKFGDKAAEVVTQKAVELGISAEDLKQLSRKSPAAVLSLFNAPAVQTPNPVTGSVVVPPINQPKHEIKPPEKSVLSGATMKEQANHLEDIRKAIYAKHGITG